VIGRYRAVVELALACAALVGVGVSWTHARHIVGVAPITDGQPATTSLVYDAQLLLLALLLAVVAGVLAVVGIARLWRARRAA
jgi:NO-binding membrane sensor protein with MHYT domain